MGNVLLHFNMEIIVITYIFSNHTATIFTRLSPKKMCVNIMMKIEVPESITYLSTYLWYQVQRRSTNSNQLLR